MFIRRPDEIPLRPNLADDSGSDSSPVDALFNLSDHPVG